MVLCIKGFRDIISGQAILLLTIYYKKIIEYMHKVLVIKLLIVKRFFYVF